MLVLSRKIGEVITIGNSIEITVLSYDRGAIRLGISAPKSIPVHRKEVYDKIIELNKIAAKTELKSLRDAMNKAKHLLNKEDRISNIQIVNFPKKDSH